MSEIMKDSAIKLFGKTITLSDVSPSEHRHSSFATSESQDSKDEHESTDPTETLTEATSSDIDDEANTPETPKNDEGSNDSNTPEEKALKKPDKIIPCPRCNSTVTKFCYYNNYNVNQPRYFCKNCQRYWTSGGTMRNVPVGSGRRKTKNVVVPGPHHIMVSNALQSGFFIGLDSGFPVSFYPAPPYWTVPVAPSSLGKHLREEESAVTTISKDNHETERSMWVPKTLRIHDPSEAAKSSIWSTLGRIKNEKTGLFRAFESKGDRIVDSSTMVRQANPAALSRSFKFQESA